MADDISDFQIEGMSVGDSLLDYFSEKEIKESLDANVYDSNKFYGKILIIKIKQYDALRVIFKKEDNKKYIIDSIGGRIDFDNDINECLLKKDEITSTISNLIKDIIWKQDQYEDADGYFTFTFADLEYGSISVSCYDWKRRIVPRGYPLQGKR